MARHPARPAGHGPCELSGVICDRTQRHGHAVWQGVICSDRTLMARLAAGLDARRRARRAGFEIAPGMPSVVDEARERIARCAERNPHGVHRRDERVAMQALIDQFEAEA